MPDLEPIQIPTSTVVTSFHDGSRAAAVIVDQEQIIKQLVERVNYLTNWIAEHEDRFKEHAHEVTGYGRTSRPVLDK